MPDETKNNTTIDYDADAGKGLEDFGTQELSMPMLVILQPMSPVLKEGDPKFNSEARPGRIYSTASGICYKEVNVIPVRFAMWVVEWKPDREGFVERYASGDEPQDAKIDPLTGKLTRSNGNILSLTYYYRCMLKEEENNHVVISMSATQLKHARAWNTMMQMRRLAIFASLYNLSVVTESNKKGTWYSWKPRWVSLVTDPQLYNQAKEANTVIDFLPKRMLPPPDETNGNNGNNQEVL